MYTGKTKELIFLMTGNLKNVFLHTHKTMSTAVWYDKINDELKTESFYNLI